MNALAARMVLFSVAMMALVTFAFAAPTSVDAEQFKARLQNLNATAQAQVAALDELAAAATDESAKADLEHQVMALKRQTEIQRLQILLEWAQAAGDEVRVAEVQTALNNWINPPQPQVMPQVERDIPAVKTTPSTDNSR